MSNQNYYFQHDTTTGVLYPYKQDTVPASSAQIEVLGPYPVDTADSTIVMAYNYPERYTAENGQIVQKPYFTISETASTTVSGQYTITATLNNPPATPPTSCTFTVLGQTYTETITNNQATFTLNVHPSVANQQFQVTVSETGCASATTTIGNTVPSIGLQACVPSGSTVPTIAPVGVGSIEYLGVYWTSTAVNQAFSQADIDTAIGLQMEMNFAKAPAAFRLLNSLLDWAQQPNYAPFVPSAQDQSDIAVITLTADENNAVSDITANVIPSIVTTLANAAPVPAAGQPQKYDQHYAHYKVVQQASKQATLNYVHDQQTLPGLE